MRQLDRELVCHRHRMLFNLHYLPDSRIGPSLDSLGLATERQLDSMVPHLMCTT